MLLGILACSLDSAKSHYLLAEKLWTGGDYPAAVSEFEKVVVKDPKGKIGLQALFRAAMIQNINLFQYSDSLRKFKAYIELSPPIPQPELKRKDRLGIFFSIKLNSMTRPFNTTRPS